MIVLTDSYSFANISLQYGQYRLLSWYITGDYKCKSPVNNPFREDNTPSLSVVDADNPYFIDHALYTSGNWISAAALYHGIIDIFDYKGKNIKLNQSDYLETLNCVIEDIKSGLKVQPYNKLTTTPYRKKMSNTSMEIIGRYWQQFDADYWNPIPLKLLIQENVFAVKSVYMPYYNYKLENKVLNPTYGYKYETGWKIYKPLDKTGNKWKSKVPNTTLDITNGISPESDVPKILCTSKKDRLIIQALTGLCTYNYQSETSNPNILRNTLAIIPDNDAVGMEYAKRTQLPIWKLTGGKDSFEIAKNDISSLKNQLISHYKKLKLCQIK